MAKNQTSNSRKFTFKARTKIPARFNLDEGIELFLSAKRLENRTEKTLKTYEQSLSHFSKWYYLEEHRELSTETIREYIEYMSFDKVKWDDHPTNSSEVKGISPRSVNNIIRILRVFFNFLVKEKHISVNPASSIKYQAETEDTFQIFTDDDVLKMLSAPNIKTYTGFRDYVMMLVLCDCGIRVGEMTQLKLHDIDFSLRQITLRGEITKTKRSRIVPISKKTATELASLVNYINVEPTDYLFLTSFGERYMADTFAKMLKKYALKVGVKGVRVSPHTFRHYFAVKFLRSNGDTFALQRILGHTDMAMTERYVKYAQADIKEKHEEASPVTNLFEKNNIKKRGKKLFK
ncbi:tyrosine-type recombinase/integrase [Gottfriedia luciferensis]|uniref:tyrosine-type recombinase/integrase n=1 Tax=Gottfriedia luciferensis TaxID=178774 RepID=UPI000B4457D3|nr:tyrosine-type recombinase/integrase [Gottfriedia luciferensis]